jgi:hypothetical protein
VRESIRSGARKIPATEDFVIEENATDGREEIEPIKNSELASESRGKNALAQQAHGVAVREAKFRRRAECHDGRHHAVRR